MVVEGAAGRDGCYVVDVEVFGAAAYPAAVLGAEVLGGNFAPLVSVEQCVSFAGVLPGFALVLLASAVVCCELSAVLGAACWCCSWCHVSLTGFVWWQTQAQRVSFPVWWSTALVLHAWCRSSCLQATLVAVFLPGMAPPGWVALPA